MIILNKEKIIRYELYEAEDAEVLVIAYGIVSRAAKGAVIKSRKKGLKVGILRFITIWPFADQIVKQMSKQVKHIIVAEINNGQLVREVERAVAGRCKVHLMPKLGGSVHTPGEIAEKIKELSNK